MQYRERGALQWGIYHYSGAPACTWHEFALEIFRQAHELGLLARVPVVRAIATADYPTPATRPAWSVLDCSKLQDAHSIEPEDWRQELHSLLKKLT
ncbi:dTDP-4-dehydrorhamnose reductase [compost metagenome]